MMRIIDRLSDFRLADFCNILDFCNTDFRNMDFCKIAARHVTVIAESVPKDDDGTVMMISVYSNIGANQLLTESCVAVQRLHCLNINDHHFHLISKLLYHK